MSAFTVSNSHAMRRVVRNVAPALVTQCIGGRTTQVFNSPMTMHAVKSQIAETCFTYFNTIKVPSTLIAASTLAALFTFTREVKETHSISKLKVMLLRFYHVLSLISFCLSLTTLLASQAATTSLLLKSNQLLASKSVDAIVFLRKAMNFEFLVTRWAFVMSVLSFLLSTTFRMIVEFGLFAPTRRLAGTMVVSMMAGVICFLVSLVNTTLSGLPGICSSTKELVAIVWYRAYIARDRLQIASVVFFAISALCSLRFLFPGSVEHDQMLDTERYT